MLWLRGFVILDAFDLAYQFLNGPATQFMLVLADGGQGWLEIGCFNDVIETDNHQIIWHTDGRSLDNPRDCLGGNTHLLGNVLDCNSAILWYHIVRVPVIVHAYPILVSITVFVNTFDNFPGIQEELEPWLLTG